MHHMQSCRLLSVCCRGIPISVFGFGPAGLTVGGEPVKLTFPEVPGKVQ